MSKYIFITSSITDRVVDKDIVVFSVEGFFDERLFEDLAIDLYVVVVLDNLGYLDFLFQLFPDSAAVFCLYARFCFSLFLGHFGQFSFFSEFMVRLELLE